jgi:hypothetical protein
MLPSSETNTNVFLRLEPSSACASCNRTAVLEALEAPGVPAASRGAITTTWRSDGAFNSPTTLDMPTLLPSNFPSKRSRLVLNPSARNRPSTSDPSASSVVLPGCRFG